VQEGVEALLGVCMPCGGAMEGEHRGVEWGVPEGALDKTGVDARCEPRRGVGRAEGVDGDAHFGHAGTGCGGPEGALDTGATHGRGRDRTVVVIAPGGGKEPGGMPRGFPGGAQQRERISGQGDIPVLGALAAMDLDLEALTVTVRDLQEEGFVEPEAHARDGGEIDLVVPGGGRCEQSLALLHTADGGEPVGRLRTQERQRGPVALEHLLGEEAETASAETHGRWGEAVDVFPRKECWSSCAEMRSGDVW
jgi:hypothetical protein